MDGHPLDRTCNCGLAVESRRALSHCVIQSLAIAMHLTLVQPCLGLQPPLNSVTARDECVRAICDRYMNALNTELTDEENTLRAAG